MNTKTLAALAAFTMVCGVSRADTATNIFNDAVFWFRGGKDCVTADGTLETGEFFDDLHADDASHANHTLPVISYPENGEFRTESVIFPALGTSVTQDVQVLHLADVSKDDGGTAKRQPLAINARKLFVGNNITSNYTLVARLRLDRLETMDWLCAIGYWGGGKKGVLLGFENYNSTKANCKRVTVYRTANADSSNAQTSFSSLYVPTNRWFDISVTVGNGKLRIGLLTQAGDISSNPVLAFGETDLWTENCTKVDGESPYRFFAENASTTPSASATTGNLEGSVQQLAVWKRTFTDLEVLEAFGMPRPAIFCTGLDNGASNEFGGTRTGSSQTIEGLGSWRDVTSTMRAGDTWTVNFPVLASESDSRGPQTPYVFSLRSMPESEAASLLLTLNGTQIGTRSMGKNAKAYWPVASNLLVPGRNTLTITRTDGWAGDFNVDAMELGGALCVGWQNGSHSEMGSTVAGRTPSAANPNPKHWWNTLQSYDGKSNMTFRVWMDPGLKDVCPAALKLRSKCLDRGGDLKIKGGEQYTIYVNGAAKGTRDAGNSFSDTEVDFLPGELNAGWNTIELKTAPYGTCYWQIDYYRFWTILGKGFTDPKLPGMIITFR